MSDKRQQRLARLRAFFTDRRSATIARWWAAGAVYFFIGWGTGLGNQNSIIDFVFSLGVVMGIFNMLVVNPAIRTTFNLGKIRPTSHNTISQRVSDYIVEIIKNIVIMLGIALIYIGINNAINAIFDLPANNIFLPGEPILFGLFYVLLYTVAERVIQAITRKLQARQGQRK